MIGDHSLLQLVLQASIVVQIVLAILVGASIMSWAIIARKRRLLSQAHAAAEEFEDRFWSGIDLAELYRTLDAAANAPGMAGVFVSGFREFSRLRQQVGLGGAPLLEGTYAGGTVAFPMTSGPWAQPVGLPDAIVPEETPGKQFDVFVVVGCDGT